jgi:hypothetical protein
MNNAQKDPVARNNLLLIGTDENFGKLPAADQKTKLGDVNGTASGIAEKKMQGMNNDQLLKLAETPGGSDQLETLKIALKNGPQTPGTIKELDRINSATFKPAGGLKLVGTEAGKPPQPADVANYLHMIRREMLTSPTFAKTMNEINADKAHPVSAKIGRDFGTVRLDIDQHQGKQDIDLADLEKLPVSPPGSSPDAITQGEVLIHAMREARERALDPNSKLPEKNQHEKAHTAAIKDENEYRKEIGQKSFRKLPPDDETVVNPNDLKDISLIIHFDNGKDEELKFDEQQKLRR